MIRSLFAVAVLATVPVAAAAQGPLQPPATFGGVTVTPPKPTDTHVIRLDMTGKGVNEMRTMIWRASNDACDRVAKATDMATTNFPLCVTNANTDGVKQMQRILLQRKTGVQADQIAIGRNIAIR